MIIIMNITIITIMTIITTMTISRDVREEDVGNYTCHATNPLGQARLTHCYHHLDHNDDDDHQPVPRQEIVVSGKPLPPVFLSGEPGDKTEYTLR